MIHIPGSKHRAADAVSRNHTGNPEKFRLIDDIALINDESNLSDYMSFQDIRHNFLSSIMIKDSSEHIPDVEIQQAAASAIINFSIQTIAWDIVRVATNSDDEMK